MTLKINILLLSLATLLILSLSINDPQPPVWSPSFYIAYDETYVINGRSYTFNGQFSYDATKNRQKAEKLNGKYDKTCNSVLPNITTKCDHLVINDKRYIVFPQKKKCCICCDSSHGCGIVKQNWFADGQYVGQQRLIDTLYDKWVKKDIPDAIYWVTSDQNQIPRKFSEDNNTHIIDYLSHTFINKTFSDSVFALPTFCNASTLCPDTSICGKVRQNINLLKEN